MTKALKFHGKTGFADVYFFLNLWLWLSFLNGRLDEEEMIM